MASPRDISHDIGEFIRDLRHNARISLRQLAEQAGVSNPYLSQIERGLRKPSAEVLQQLASALRVSTPIMYLRAGLLGDEGTSQGVLEAIAHDPGLTMAQKQTLTQIYETFKRENARDATPGPDAAPVSVAAAAAAGSAAANGHAASAARTARVVAKTTPVTATTPTKTTPTAAASRTAPGARSKKGATSKKTVADAATPKTAVKTATKEK